METKAYDLKQNAMGSGCCTTLQKEATLMCPKCFDLIRIEQNGTILATNKDETEYINLLVVPRYHCDCPTCHTQGEFIPVDSLIASAVSKLNKAGYLTEQCCNSHDGRVSNIFIKFKDEYMFDTLPIGFEMNGVFLKPWDLDAHRYVLIEHLNDWVHGLTKSKVSDLLSKATGD